VNEENKFGEAPAQESEEVIAAAAVDGEEQGMVLEPELPVRQYCVFRAGRERFSLMVLDVEEVVEWP